MKKFISAAVSCAILVSAATCNMTASAAFSDTVISSSKTATSGTCGENVTWTLDDEGTLTFSGTGPMVTTYFGSPEWERDENGILQTINKVVIEEGVTSISGTAFSGCAMTEIEIADSVTSIGNFAFLSCENLTEITLPKNLTEISMYALLDCKSLRNITIPASVTSIGNGPFFGCDSMTEIIVEEGNANYVSVDGVLYTKDMKKLVSYPTGKTDTDYAIAEGVTEIVGGAFGSNDNLVSVIIPDSVTDIYEEAFGDCSKIEEVILPESVAYIDEYVFRGCESLKSVVFENSDCVIYDASHTICNTYEFAADSTIKYIGNYTGTIYGYEGSTAQTYAEKYGFAFEALEEKTYSLGDVDGNGTIDPVDATLVLRQYCLASMNAEDLLDEAQKTAADVDTNLSIDPVDATYILRYYSYASMNGTETIEDFIAGL